MQRFFAPGRTELAGNHTDHQLGRVLAASVDVGITARATRRRDRRVCIHSKGFRPFTVALDDLVVDPRAYGKPWALVRGMAAAILDAGGVAIRAGHHCAQPLMEYLGIGSCCRASVAIYNTEEDVDALLENLENVRRVMGL